MGKLEKEVAVSQKVDLAVQLDQDIKTKSVALKDLKGELVDYAKLMRETRLSGTVGTASISISVGRDYQIEKVWKYLREEKKLSEKEALKYFGIKATAFQKDFGERTADRMSTDGRVTEKVTLKMF